MKTRRSLTAYAEALIALLAEASPTHQREILRSFVRLLVRERLLHRADRILDDVERLLLEEQGKLRAEIDLPDATLRDHVPMIERLLTDIVGQPVATVTHIRPALLAGFRARVEDLVIDASLQTSLSRLRSSLHHT